MGLTKVLGEHMHYGLVNIFDDAVIVRGDMKVDLGGGRASAAVKSRKRQRSDAVLPRPFDGPHDIFRIARRTDCQQNVSRRRHRAQLIDKHIVVRNVVGDRGDDFDV